MIELGVLPTDDEPDRVGYKPRAPWQWLRAAALTAICLSLLAGPAPAPRMDLLAKIDVFGDPHFLIADEDLVVADATGVSLYHQGKRSWWLRDALGETYDLERHGDLLVLTTGGLQITRVGVNLRTGERRWAVHGPAIVAGDYLLTHIRESVLEVRTLTNGALLWTLPDISKFSIDTGRSVVGSLAPDGVLTEWDLATGTIQRRATLPLLESKVDWFAYEHPWLNVIVELAENKYDTTTFDVETLQKTMVLNPAVDDCGEFNCRPSGEEPGYELLDKATGELRFRLPGWVTLERTKDGLMGLTADDGSQLFDPHTGKLASMPSGWVRLSDRSLGTASAHFQRPYTDTLAVKDADNGLYLGELHGDGLRVLGFLPHILVDSYSAIGRVLAYQFDQQVWWWQLGRP